MHQVRRHHVGKPISPPPFKARGLEETRKFDNCQLCVQRLIEQFAVLQLSFSCPQLEISGFRWDTAAARSFRNSLSCELKTIKLPSRQIEKDKSYSRFCNEWETWRWFGQWNRACKRKWEYLIWCFFHATYIMTSLGTSYGILVWKIIINCLKQTYNA